MTNLYYAIDVFRSEWFYFLKNSYKRVPCPVSGGVVKYEGIIFFVILFIALWLVSQSFFIDYIYQLKYIKNH